MIDAVLLVAFGGPTAPNEIRPFLEIVARGRRIPPERLAEIARHYEAMPGGRSPLNELTFAQARGLESALARGGPALPVFVGMRNWHPFLHETLAEMAAKGARRALGIILSPLRTEASWDRYQRDVAESRARVPGAPEVVFAPAWSAHPRFLDAVAARARAALEEVPAGERAWTPLVFTAHSVPVAMADASPYVADLTAATRAVAQRLHHPRWSIAYQSRSGPPPDAWLEPDVGDVLGRLAADGERHVVVVPIGFVCDHVELLYDLDVEARALARERGLALHRAASVNDHPEFIAMLADLVRSCAAPGAEAS
ncbi:MAG: ferrochelatase [Candidatus Rokubacteria bacterium]|nr:ferrochelatase [Candidatus Rokubacteria bacterium]